MNAGAYGGEMKQVLESAVVLTAGGRASDDSGRRTGTCLPYKCGRKERLYGGRSNDFSLKKGEQAEIREVMDDLKQRRVTKQPLEYWKCRQYI